MRSVVLLAVLLCGCGNILSGTDGVHVRVHNLSALDLDSVTVIFPKDTHRYGRLEAGARSEYLEVREAYRYAKVEMWVGDKSHVIQPIDFVGEHLLPEGRYTYGLTLGGDPLTPGIVMADQYQDDRILFLTEAKPATAAMQALYQGRVATDAAGCVRLDGATPATVIWPYGFRRAGERVLDQDGREVGKLGGSFRFGGGFIGKLPDYLLDDASAYAARLRCPGEYWLVGET